MKQTSPPINKEKSQSREYSYVLKIPKERIAVLIGTKGETKSQLEENSQCSINVDSKEGEVFIKGTNSIKLFTLKEVIRAIARGFNPETAQLLLKQDYCLEIVSLTDYSSHKSHQQRLKGRVIGRNGKARESIEELTNCFISVFGKTIAIIGEITDAPIAKRAIESLLMGSMHNSVYKWLEKQKRNSFDTS